MLSGAAERRAPGLELERSAVRPRDVAQGLERRSSHAADRRVFDSGVGGLTVLHELLVRSPAGWSRASRWRDLGRPEIAPVEAATTPQKLNSRVPRSR
jgi:hypothetical protein